MPPRAKAKATTSPRTTRTRKAAQPAVDTAAAELDDLDDDDLDPDEFDLELEDEDVEVADDLVFESKAPPKGQDGKAKRYPFRLDGKLYYSVQPKGTVFLRLEAAASPRAARGEAAAAAALFLDAALEEDSRMAINARLIDYDDPFEIDDLIPIYRKLARHWAKAMRKNNPGAASNTGPTSRRTGRRR